VHQIVNLVLELYQINVYHVIMDFIIWIINALPDAQNPILVLDHNIFVNVFILTVLHVQQLNIF
jgi:hypothetical protein